MGNTNLSKGPGAVVLSALPTSSGQSAIANVKNGDASSEELEGKLGS